MFSSAARPKIFLVSLLLAISSHLSSQTLRNDDLTNLVRAKANWDYRSFVLEKLHSSRILVLADEGHGTGLYCQTVITVLNDWIRSFEAESGKAEFSGLPRKLYLILEMDSLHAKVDKALATLKSETGEDFRTAKDWTRWLEQTTL